jgi:hypothetical protein
MARVFDGRRPRRVAVLAPARERVVDAADR